MSLDLNFCVQCGQPLVINPSDGKRDFCRQDNLTITTISPGVAAVTSLDQSVTNPPAPVIPPIDPGNEESEGPSTDLRGVSESVLPEQAGASGDSQEPGRDNGEARSQGPQLTETKKGFWQR